MNNKARKIKITVIDPKSDVKLSLPALHFSFISFMASSALLFKPFIKRHSNLDDEAISALDAIDKEMIDEIFNELKLFGPFDLVDISTGDGTMVKISTL